jgi:hypothetical protein
MTETAHLQIARRELRRLLSGSSALSVRTLLPDETPSCYKSPATVPKTSIHYNQAISSPPTLDLLVSFGGLL